MKNLNICKIDTKFKQQTLPASKPVFNAAIVLPLMFSVSLVFIPIGIALLYVSTNLVEDISVDYTDCRPVNLNNELDIKCSQVIQRYSRFSSSHQVECKCRLHFIVEKPLQGQVYVHYALSGFYQSHRRYAKSFDSLQLSGRSWKYEDLSWSCEPFRSKDDLAYTPCGAIANSLFNDTLALSHEVNGSLVAVPVRKDGIAWITDKAYIFSNPASKDAMNDTLPPPQWRRGLFDLDPRGYLNEDLIVWMRTAAFPSFRKLYRIVNHAASPHFKGGLPAGKYILDINYNYPVLSFGGRKRLVLSTTAWIGGQNLLLGICYLTVGITSIVTGSLLACLYMRQKSRLELLLSSEYLNDKTSYSPVNF